MSRLPLLILVLLSGTCNQEPIVQDRYLIFNVVIEKQIHALSFEIKVDSAIFDLSEFKGGDVIPGAFSELWKEPTGIMTVVYGQRGVHEAISGAGEICRFKLKQLVEPSQAQVVLEGEGNGIFYGDKRELRPFSFKHLQRLDQTGDIVITLNLGVKNEGDL